MGLLAFLKGGWGFLLGSLVPFGGALLIEYLDRAYRIGYDNDAIYMRPHGVSARLTRRRVVRIPFSDIAAVTAQRNRRANPVMEFFTPFDYARVSRREWEVDDEEFALVGGELFDDDFREILHLIDQRAPGMLDEAITQWLASTRRF